MGLSLSISQTFAAIRPRSWHLLLTCKSWHAESDCVQAVHHDLRTWPETLQNHLLPLAFPLRLYRAVQGGKMSGRGKKIGPRGRRPVGPH